MECRDCGAAGKLWKIGVDYVIDCPECEFERGPNAIRVECYEGYIIGYAEEYIYCPDCAERMLAEYYDPALRAGIIKSLSLDTFYNRPIAKNVNHLRIIMGLR